MRLLPLPPDGVGAMEKLSLSDPKITAIQTVDLRFPTSLHQIGSDAVNKDPDYSAAYCIVQTDSEFEGHGLTFTLGRGTELCVLAIQYLSRALVGREVSAITEDMGAFARQLIADTQFRWLGPEKGVIHLAAAAIVNAVWDLYAKIQGKPLWLLHAGLGPEQMVSDIDFQYIDDALARLAALEILHGQR